MKQKLVILSLFIFCSLILGACAANSAITLISPLVLNPTVILDTPTSTATFSVVSTEPTLAPDASSYFPPVSDADFSFGPADAPVTLIEYCDFQSSGCRALFIAIATLMKNRQDVRFVFRPFPLIGVDGMDKSEKAVLAALAADKQEKFSECPPFNVDAAKQYIATIHTEKGNIVIELLPDKAPLAVNSFVFLARAGWFDGVTFHRVIPAFAAQAGDPSGTGRGNPGYLFKNEVSDLKFDQPGL